MPVRAVLTTFVSIMKGFVPELARKKLPRRTQYACDLEFLYVESD